MRSKEVMMEDLRFNTKILGISQQIDKFLDIFAERVANRKLNSMELVKEWETARQLSYREPHSMTVSSEVILRKNFGNLIKALVPLAVAKEAIELQKKAKP